MKINLKPEMCSDCRFSVKVKHKNNIPELWCVLFKNHRGLRNPACYTAGIRKDGEYDA